MACPGKSGGFQYCPDAVLDENTALCCKTVQTFTPVVLYRIITGT